ncbi:MAG: hypothetical protein ACQEP1_06535 [Nanobdellota archaeon]
MKRAQSSIEFSLVIGIMVMTLSVFLIFLNTQMIEMQRENKYAILSDMGEVIESEMELANSVEDGYTRTIRLPETLDGFDYHIGLRNGSTLGTNYSIITMGYNESEDLDVGDYVFFLGPNISGEFEAGNNIIEKDDGRIYVNKST